MLRDNIGKKETDQSHVALRELNVKLTIYCYISNRKITQTSSTSAYLAQSKLNGHQNDICIL